MHNISYSYDNLNRLSTVSENGAIEATYTYDANGNRATLTLGNGVVTTYSYNLANWVTNLSNKNSNGDVLSSYSYTYYASGNQKSKTDNGVVTSYVYDDLGRLTSESETNGVTLSYTYDSAGNRTKLTATGSESYITDYSYNAVNQLTSEVKTIGGTTETTTYIYDANGNTLSVMKPGSIRVNEYNLFNELVATNANGSYAAYAYNTNGIRTAKSVNGTCTSFLLDGGNVVGEVQNGEVTAIHLRGANLLSTSTDDETSYYLFNAHGDVTGIANDAQTVTKAYEYDAFGVEKDPSITDENPFRYCGEYFDKETGTYYLRARYYDPTIGRFTQQDSVRYSERSLPTGNITDPLSLNYYVYSANNPIYYCDPSGHAFDIIWDIVGFCWSAADFYNDPSWENAGYIAWDIVGIALPVFPGSCVAKVAKVGTKYDEFLDSLGLLSKVKRVDNGVEFITSVKKGTDIVELAKSGKYLVGSYHDMKKYTHGYNHAIEAHHILEQRIFKGKFDTNEMLSVVIPGDLHKQFTKSWSEIIPKNSNYKDIINDSTKLKEAINYVYKDHPELLALAEKYLDSLKLGGK